MATPKLSLTERLILRNQYSILLRLDQRESGFYQEAIDILERGYEGEFYRLFELMSDESLTTQECHEVIDFMSMHDALRHSYAGLSSGDQQEIAASGLMVRLPGGTRGPFMFEGFDGNHETKWLAYARHVIKHGRFTDFTPETPTGLNTHYPMLGTYRRMTEAWHASKDEYHLSKADIFRILQAGRNAPYPGG